METTKRDPYRGAIVALLAVATAGAISAFLGAAAIENSILLAMAATLAIEAAILGGVLVAQQNRLRPRPPEMPPETRAPIAADVAPEVLPENEPAVTIRPKSRALETALKAWRDFQDIKGKDGIRRFAAGTSVAGLLAIVYLILSNDPTAPLDLTTAAMAAGICFIAAGLTATAAHYLSEIASSSFPEALGLTRGARVAAWLLVLCGVSMGFAWANLQAMLWISKWAIFAVDLAVCYALFEASFFKKTVFHVFPLDLPVLSVLGTRPNILASILDAGEGQLGIDLRSTWALTVVRLSIEPLLVGLCLVGWLSTSLTAVGAAEQGLVEHLGVPAEGAPLAPGLHLHWPWPIDQVFRIPVQRVQVLTVGHEGEEEGGPENVLWAKQHAANEYTLLLGNGSDLITVDAAVQFRIIDARAWRYHTQNPADALRAIAYRAVMRSTVNRTLSDALSENVVTLTEHMRSVVQQDADALGLGVDVMGFTVGGMHPPVAVAADYQAVVSAELRKVTAVVNAQASRNQSIPLAEAYAVRAANEAHAEAARALAKAAGEAWSFRTSEAQYNAAPAEYLFRRRLEALERNLAGRRLTIVDARFERDGGELWVTP